MQDTILPDDLPQAPQQMPGPNSDAVYADYIRERKVENLIQQINPDNLLADIEARIRGFRKNQLTSQWEEIPGRPKISEKLVGNFMSFLGSILNNCTTLSNYGPQEINNLMEMIIEYVSDDLETNAEDYGISNNYTERTRIGMIILNTVFSTFKRALNGAESSRIFKALKIGEQSNPYQQQMQSPSIWEAMKFWK